MERSAITRTFVMGDIHGAYKALLQCLERASFDYENDKLIQLGDVVDGYPEAFECVERLLELKNLISIRGNHDDWFDIFLKTGIHPSYWDYGGEATSLSYLKHSGKNEKIFAARNGYKTALVPNDIPQSHQAYFNNLQLYHIDAHNRCFVHAGFNRHLSFFKQQKETFYWDRALWVEGLQVHTYSKNRQCTGAFFDVADFNEIYIGHTPTTKWGTDKPLRALNILNLDTGAGHAGRLTIMDIDTKKYWQSDPLLTLYEGKV